MRSVLTYIMDGWFARLLAIALWAPLIMAT